MTYNKEFWKAAFIRAVRTIAQTALALLGTATVSSYVNWSSVVISSLMAGLLSVLTSIATGLPEASKDDE